MTALPANDDHGVLDNLPPPRDRDIRTRSDDVNKMVANNFTFWEPAPGRHGYFQPFVGI